MSRSYERDLAEGNVLGYLSRDDRSRLGEDFLRVMGEIGISEVRELPECAGEYVDRYVRDSLSKSLSDSGTWVLRG